MISFKTDANRADWPKLPGLLRLGVEIGALVYGIRFNRPLVVTSTAGDTHKAGSKHYEYRAVDLRANDLPAADAEWFASFLAVLFPILGGRALYESPGTSNAHYHVQV